MGPKSRSGVGWGGVGLSQTSPIPRSSDGDNKETYIKDNFTKKKVLGLAQIFCHLFISAFLVNKRSLFPPKCQ